MGPDHVENQHRVYGKHRLQLILHMWEPIDIVNHRLHLNEGPFGSYANQPVWVLKKKNHATNEHHRDCDRHTHATH